MSAQSTRLGPAPSSYDQLSEQGFRSEMDRRDLLVHKKGRHIDLGGNSYYIVLYSPNGSRWSVTVSNAGALVVTAL